jgi:CBS domain-containing protein
VNAANEPVRTLVKRPVVMVEPGSTLRQAAATLAEDYIGVAVVRGPRPIGGLESGAQGLISERDIVRALAEGADPDDELVRDVMTLDLATAAPGDTVMSVAEHMLDNEIRHVPLVEGGVVVGLVSERDLLRTLARERQPARRS